MCIKSHELSHLFDAGPDEEVTTAETHRETIEIQHTTPGETAPTPETQKVTKTVHIPGRLQTRTIEVPRETTQTDQQVMLVEEIPTGIEVPEDTTYSETIELDGKPKTVKPRQVEIRVGMPKAPGPTPTTADVIKETTTFTTITSEMHHAPEEIPQIKEGQETRTTTITFDKQPGKQPTELVVEVPEKPKKSDVIAATQLSTTTVTKEMRIHELEDEEEQVPETHTETIEIVKDTETQPQEVQLKFEIPKSKPTETTTMVVDTDSLTATKHIEVEIQEAVMQQKPKQTTIVIPKPETVPQQVEVPRPEVEQIEETRPTIEKVTKVIPEKARPQQQEMVFEISAKPEVTDQIVPFETETPAPVQPEEIVEREVIKVKPVPETNAPEIEMEISERDTIQIVKEPVQETVQFEIEVSESVPEVTETVTTERVTEKTTIEQEVPQVEETHKEEITFDIQGKPMEEVQLSFQVQPTEKQLPEMKEIQTIEKTSVTETEKVQIPKIEEIPKKDEPIVAKETPEETVTMTIDVKEVETTEIEEVPKDEEMSVPSVTETRKEETTLEFQDKPSEEVKFTIHVQPEKGAPVKEVVHDVEQVSLETRETIQLPEVEETHKEEITLDIQGKPRDEIQLSFKVDETEKQLPEAEEVKDVEKVTTVVSETVQLPQLEETEVKLMPLDMTDAPSESVTMTIQISEKEAPEIKETTQIETTEITKKIETEVTEVEDKPKQEITVDTQARPLEAVQFDIQITDKKVPETEETIPIESTETVKTFTVQVPEGEEKHKEEITIETHERPTEAVQFEIQVGEKEVPETTVVTDTESTTETVTKVIELPTTEETHRDEITLDIGQKPETVQMEIEVPTDVQETITFTTEVTEEVAEETPEVGETVREEISLEIKGKPVEMKEMEIKIPVKPKEEAETSPKQTSPLQAPTTEEIFETFEQGAPEFTWGLVNLKVMDGEEAKFRCEVQASPTPEIAWFHDEKPIAENQDFR